jgi:hypothetical protein
MDTSGKINDLGKQYIDAEGPQINISGNAKVMTPSIRAMIFFMLAASIGAYIFI